MSLAAA